MKKSNLYAIAILFLMSFLLGLIVGQWNNPPLPKVEPGIVLKNLKEPTVLPKEIDFNLFWEVWNLVKKDYVDKPVKDEKLFYGALGGIVSSLKDPYSVFLEPETAKKFNEDLQGSFSGIGAEIGIKNERLTIIAPLPNTPAQKIGLKAGDKVLAIDGEDTTGIALDYAVSKIRGPKGTTVKLLITREGFKEPKEFIITREQIEIPSVKWEIKNNNIAYINVIHFNEDTTAKFQEAVRQLLAKNPSGFILDLRNNPGGFLDKAVKIASYWIEDEPIVIEQFSSGKKKEYPSSNTALLKDFKTIVLINEGSASGSEIVAGALQDYGKATLIGKKTFGKGSVQNLESLKDGSAVKLTIAKWLTPKGRFIDKEGIKPDIEIELTQEDYNKNKDPQLEKAIEILSGISTKD